MLDRLPRSRRYEEPNLSSVPRYLAYYLQRLSVFTICFASCGTYQSPHTPVDSLESQLRLSRNIHHLRIANDVPQHTGACLLHEDPD
jgi:hypothetical protein